MGWITMSARRANLTRSVNEHKFEQLSLSRQLRQLSTFSNAIGDGTFSPSEISSLGVDLFGIAVNHMQNAHIVASDLAQIQASEYINAYQNATNDQLINSGLALYTTADGMLDEQKLLDKFYQEELKEYAEEELKPILNQLELDIEMRKNEIDSIVASEEAELEQLNGSISQGIQSTTINLA